MNKATRTAGFAMVEVVIALVILSTVLIALGGIMFQMTRNGTKSANVTLRSGAMLTAEAWVQGLPYDSLASSTFVGCGSQTIGSVSYTRCLTYTDVTSTLRRAKVVITFSGLYAALPETLVVDRTKPSVRIANFNIH
ncbi:MAG TPA: hypothetical protein VGI83_03675 [Gemmatimonadales bacterium]|jgi:Tfp pilus assembly protein PilV